MFKKSDIDEAGTIVNLLKTDWLSKKDNYLKSVDVGAATKASFEKMQVPLEKKRKFRNDCRGIITTLLLKLSERYPLKYAIVRNANSLSPASIAANNDEYSVRCGSLADRCKVNPIHFHVLCTVGCLIINY